MSNDTETSAQKLSGVEDQVKLAIDPSHMFMDATDASHMALCLSDPAQADMPIVYANDAFTDLTGYGRDEVIGRNCRFLQGEDTRPEDVERIRTAIAERKVAVIDVLNYRKDGTPFWNALHIGPVYNKQGNLEYFYGSQWDVTEVFRHREEAERQRQVSQELHHRTGNLFAVMSAIVRLSARKENDAKALAGKIESRLGALARAHRVSITSSTSADAEANLRSLVEAVVKPYREDADERITVDGDRLLMPSDIITAIGLSLHELATNAVKYGALGHPDGRVAIEWGLDEDVLAICWIERGGIAKSPAEVATANERAKPGGGGSGTRIVSGILSGIEASIQHDFEEHGLTATIRLPRKRAGL